MTTLTLELPAAMYQQLHEQADRLGKPPQDVVQEWVAERLAPPTRKSPAASDFDPDRDLDPESDRAKVRRALRAAGLLTELGPGLKARAEAGANVSLEEVIADMSRAGGKPLSEILLEQRRSKDW